MKKLTTASFTLKAIKVHGTKFDYSSTVYITNKQKVTIICPIHGEFEQTPNSHLRGCGCNKCGIEETNRANTQSKEDFIIKANKAHSSFYTYDSLVYTSVHNKLLITCPIHGNFLQKGNSHLSGQGCPECGKAKAGNSRSFFTGKRTILYVIKLDESKYKIGVTSRTVAKRYYGDIATDYKVVFQVSFFDGKDAFNIEQQITKEFKIHNYVGEMVFKRTKNHEVFKVDPTSRVIELILNKVSS